MSIDLRGVTVDLPIYTSNARSLRRTLTEATVGGALMARPDNRVVVRALTNVSLTIGDGERVALVGGNGAGKTTLLKVLAGIYTPSSGSVRVEGRVSPALNVGLGLDMEMSGRENIFLLGYYRGFSRAEIAAAVPTIVEIADLGSFIELPVHTYSSGMLGRLTFATATAFKPDVLLMDEWLLAGDASFMARAFGRTAEFVGEARILVLATHNLGVVREVCTRAIYMKAGQIVDQGPTALVVDRYMSDVAAAA